MGQQGKPPTLAKMKTLAHHIDSHHLEHLHKKSCAGKNKSDNNNNKPNNKGNKSNDKKKTRLLAATNLTTATRTTS